MTALLERMPAIRRIDTDRRDAHAFELAGEVSGADIENLYGLLDGALAIDPEIDLLLRFVDHEGVDWDGELSEQSAAMQSEARRRIRRIALIGAPSRLASGSGFLAPLAGELQRFDMADEDAAWAYIGARPA